MYMEKELKEKDKAWRHSDHKNSVCVCVCMSEWVREYKRDKEKETHMAKELIGEPQIIVQG